MPNLEKYIKDHLDEFDSNEPADGHFERFQERLPKQAELTMMVHNRTRLLKVAALIIILISVSVFLVEFAGREIRERFASANQGTELPTEIREAILYYDNQTHAQLGTLNKLTASNPGALSLSESALVEMRNLDKSTADLKVIFLSNPGNENILDAIIRNQQMKETILKNIIHQLSQSKN